MLGHLADAQITTSHASLHFKPMHQANSSAIAAYSKSSSTFEQVSTFEHVCVSRAKAVERDGMMAHWVCGNGPISADYSVL